VLVAASNAARDLIRECGGSLYVWATDHRCCGGRLTLLDSSTSAPHTGFGSESIEADGFTVFLDAGRRGRPAELVLEVRGVRRKRIEAFWNGCAYVD
jgi:hypothetical protein